MKFIAFACMVMAAVSAQDPPVPPVTDYPIQKWMTPNLLAGLGVFLLFLFISIFGFGAMTAIQVPNYQLKANDEKNKEDNRDWVRMWGRIENS